MYNENPHGFELKKFIESIEGILFASSSVDNIIFKIAENYKAKIDELYEKLEKNSEEYKNKYELLQNDFAKKIRNIEACHSKSTISTNPTNSNDNYVEKSKLIELENIIKDKNYDIEDLLSQIQYFEDSNKELKTMLDKELEYYSIERPNYINTINNMQKHIDCLSLSNNDLSKQLTHFEQTKEELSHAQQTINNQHKKILEEEEKNTVRKNLIEKLELEIGSVTNKVSNKNLEVAKLNDIIDTKTKENNALTKEIRLYIFYIL